MFLTVLISFDEVVPCAGSLCPGSAVRWTFRESGSGAPLEGGTSTFAFLHDIIFCFNDLEIM